MALAYKLQEEEHAAFMEAVRVGSPRSGGQRFTPGSAAPLGAERMETEDADDESLQLALQLQQEELEWQVMH